MLTKSRELNQSAIWRIGTRFLVATLVAAVLAGPASPAAATSATRTVTVEKIGTGSGRITLSGIYTSEINCGEVCTANLDAQADWDLAVEVEPGSILIGWSGDCFTEDGGCRLRASGTDQRAIARIDKLRSIEVSITGNGSVGASNGYPDISCSTDPESWSGDVCIGQFVDSSSVVLYATPAAGYMFAGWTGACTGWTCTIAPGSSPATLGAVFVTRRLLSNRKVHFLDADSGKSAVGGTVTWVSSDGRYKSSKAVNLGTGGIAVFPSIPGGSIQFTIWNTSLPDWTATSTDVISIDGGGTKQILLGRVSVIAPRVHVTFPDGRPVPGAQFFLSHAKSTLYPNQCTGVDMRIDWSEKWILKGCKTSATTDDMGYATVRVMEQGELNLNVEINDGDITYMWGESAYWDPEVDSLTMEVVVDPLPYVELVAPNAVLNYGSLTTFSAIAFNDSDQPISGQKLTLTAAVSAAFKSCAGSKTVATTNAEGLAVFKVCPVKTARWSVDGRSIIRSVSANVTVQLTPTAPRTMTATAKTRSVSLAWVAPAKVNASAVTDYVVQYRLQGATTWVTFRDGTSTTRKATVTGLTSGQVYEFRVAAKNKTGTGTWSGVVLGTSN